MILHRYQKGFPQSNLQAFKRYICIYKEQKGHQVEGNQQRISKYFFSTINLFKERNKKFVTLLTKEKWLRMSGKMMTLTFFELRAVHTQFPPPLKLGGGSYF